MVKLGSIFSSMPTLLDLVRQPGFQLTSNYSSTRRSLRTSLQQLAGTTYSLDFFEIPAKDLVDRFTRRRISPEKFLKSPTERTWMAAVTIKVIY